jgi:hypothetical protein
MRIVGKRRGSALGKLHRFHIQEWVTELESGHTGSDIEIADQLSHETRVF